MPASVPCLLWRGKPLECWGQSIFPGGHRGHVCSRRPPRHPLLLAGSLGSGGWAAGSSHPSLSLCLDHPWVLCFPVPSSGCWLEPRSGLERFPPQCVFQSPAFYPSSNPTSCLIPGMQSTRRAWVPWLSTAPRFPKLPHIKKRDPQHTQRAKAHLDPTSALNSGDIDSFIPSLSFFLNLVINLAKKKKKNKHNYERALCW